MTQGHDNRPGERREVDDEGGIEAPRIGKGIRKYQPSLCIRVVHLGRHAVVVAENVSGPQRGTPGKVLGRRDDPDDVDREFQPGGGLHCRDHDRAPGHVHFHLRHPCGRLDGDSA